MTIIDLFREFSQVSTTEGYPQSSRILFYTVLYLWNERRRPDVIEVSTEKLYTLAGLPETTYRDALKYLTDRYWLKRVKSRSRGITALLMRDRREKTAPPAGFPMDARAEKSTERREESPNGDSSKPINKVPEVPANVRTDSCASDTGANPTSPTTERVPANPNDEIYGGNVEFEVPDFTA